MYRLDIFEGSQYSRESVTVQVLGHDVGLDETVADERTAALVVGEVEAQTYVWRMGPDTLDAQEWDFEVFKREKMNAWMGIAETGQATAGVEVDEGFAEVDRAVKAEQDSWKRDEAEKLANDPMGGRGANGHITQQLENAIA